MTFTERSRLSHESVNHLRVVLRKYGWNNVPLRGKIEQREEIIFFLHLQMILGSIYVRKLIDHRIFNDVVILKGKALSKVQFLLRIRITRITVEHTFNHICSLSSKGNVIGVGSAAHGEEKPSAYNEILNVNRHRTFHFRDFAESKFGSCCFLISYFVPIPRRHVVCPVKLSILTREILVVQVKPIVFRKFSSYNFFIINTRVRNFSVGKNQRYRIVPGLLAKWSIYRNLRSHFQLHLFHVHFRVGYFSINSVNLRIGNHLKTDSSLGALFLNAWNVFHQKTSTSIIQQPFDRKLLLQNPIGNAV